jgi:hypothetical protein
VSISASLERRLFERRFEGHPMTDLLVSALFLAVVLLLAGAISAAMAALALLRYGRTDDGGSCA